MTVFSVGVNSWIRVLLILGHTGKSNNLIVNDFWIWTSILLCRLEYHGIELWTYRFLRNVYIVSYLQISFHFPVSVTLDKSPCLSSTLVNSSLQRRKLLYLLIPTLKGQAAIGNVIRIDYYTKQESKEFPTTFNSLKDSSLVVCATQKLWTLRRISTQ